MLISMPFCTSSLHPWSSNHSSTRSLNCMACLHPSYLTEIPHLLASFNRNYSNFKGLSWKWALPIIHRQMGKQKKLLNAWKCTCIALPQKGSTSGSNGFLLDEWWYNTTYHATTKMTPYEAVYGKQPPSLTYYIPSNFQGSRSGDSSSTWGLDIGNPQR